MAGEGEDFLAGGGVPDLHGLVLTCGSEALAVRTIGNAEDAVRVFVEDEEFATRLGFPDGDGAVVTSRGEMVLIGAESHTGHDLRTFFSVLPRVSSVRPVAMSQRVMVPSSPADARRPSRL